jgi:hypothetical protein
MDNPYKRRGDEYTGDMAPLRGSEGRDEGPIEGKRFEEDGGRRFE